MFARGQGVALIAMARGVRPVRKRKSAITARGQERESNE